MYWILAVFFYLSCAVYTVWSLVDPFHLEVEWVGTIALGLCGTLFAFIAFYLAKGHRNQGGELVEDREDANIDDGDPEVGEFAPWSWWPLVLAAAAGLVLLGLAVGFWIAFFAAPLVLIAIVGWTYEFYRGNFVR